MNLTRREFVGSVSAAAAVSGVRPEMIMSAGDDPLGVRGDFPVVREGIYLDSAYITPSPRQAVQAAQAFAEAKARSPVSLGAMLEETDAVRGRFARLIGATEPEVGVLFATSDGENIVARALDLGPGDNVVIDDLHYETTYILYQHLADSRGLEVRVVPNAGGEADADAFAEHVDERTRLISVAWVSHQNGYHHDLSALAELAHAHGAYLYADAIQGIGMLDLDVKSVGIDFLTSGTYKWLLGGFGVAPFYIREELLDLVPTDRLGSLQVAEELGGRRFRLHEDAKKYGYATMAFGAVFQLRAALDYLIQVGVANIERHTVDLAHRLHAGLVAQGFDVWTPAGNRSSIVTFEHHRDLDLVRHTLGDAGIRLSFKEEGAKLRVGAALFNTADEIDRLLEVSGGWA
jgi:selenocysteine lyase/cysteine desulfurase